MVGTGTSNHARLNAESMFCSLGMSSVVRIALDWVICRAQQLIEKKNVVTLGRLTTNTRYFVVNQERVFHVEKNQQCLHLINGTVAMRMQQVKNAKELNSSLKASEGQMFDSLKVD